MLLEDMPVFLCSGHRRLAFALSILMGSMMIDSYGHHRWPTRGWLHPERTMWPGESDGLMRAV